ncbi:MAG: 50S ribosomal protein L23 [Planctomycetia bacterium]|nr:50S ribosomal protein L23 [Planctomycetia bacterium]
MEIAKKVDNKQADKGPMLEPHQVILRPLVTEKGVHRSTRTNQYAFEVNTLADKDDVKRAVEALFEVSVEKVRTQNRKGKPRRHKFRYGYTKNWKKALVTLNSEHRIDFF